jgi:hypothetical protein
MKFDLDISLLGKSLLYIGGGASLLAPLMDYNPLTAIFGALGQAVFIAQSFTRNSLKKKKEIEKPFTFWLMSIFVAATLGFILTKYVANFLNTDQIIPVSFVIGAGAQSFPFMIEALVEGIKNKLKNGADEG